MKVAKFGGTSLASADQIRKAVEIIKADRSRQCVVVSAPGKRSPDDVKITDLLYSLAKPSEREQKWMVESAIINRYQTIIDELGLKINFKEWFKIFLAASKNIGCSAREDFTVSHGEYWMAKIVVELLDYKFIDAKSFISFTKSGKLSMTKTEKRAKLIGLQKMATETGVVIPGFYGSMPGGIIKTFSRGGSDITGAIVALCVNAKLYENWTDVSGVFMADPRIIASPKTIKELTYAELRELAYMGANVLHEEAVFPVRKAGIPINVRNTNFPRDKGTMIVGKNGKQKRTPGTIIGIAGRRNFCIVRLEKAMMDSEVGFLRRACHIMEKHKINIEHIPSGIDTLSVVVESTKFNTASESILKELRKKCKPDAIDIEKNVALICIVGCAMARTPGVAARISKAIAKAGVNIRIISQGSSEISIIVGVNDLDYTTTIRAIYKEFATDQTS